MHDTKETLIWHGKSTFESTKMQQVDQLLLLQAAYLEDIIHVTVTNAVVAHTCTYFLFECTLIQLVHVLIQLGHTLIQ